MGKRPDDTGDLFGDAPVQDAPKKAVCTAIMPVTQVLVISSSPDEIAEGIKHLAAALAPGNLELARLKRLQRSQRASRASSEVRSIKHPALIDLRWKELGNARGSAEAIAREVGCSKRTVYRRRQRMMAPS